MEFGMKGIKDRKERGKKSKDLNVWPQGPPDYERTHYFLLCSMASRQSTPAEM